MWDEVSGAAAYEVEVDGEIVEPVNIPIYTHSDLKSNDRHTYRVRAKNDTVYSEWSEAVSQITAPGVPGNLKAEAKSDTITLTWNVVPGALNYDIEIDGDIVRVNEPLYVHEGLKSNTMHMYRVRANN